MPDQVPPLFLDADNRDAIERYLLGRALVTRAGLPVGVATAGAGNMNLALRITPAAGPSFILKQGRPWVEKYKQIPAPFERTLVEAAFYAAAHGNARVGHRMPALLHVDRDNHVLVLEDLGGAGDFTSIYAEGRIRPSVVGALLDWLEDLAGVTPAGQDSALFANRAMRALNHEHMFRFPLLGENGLDLDAITPGLAAAAVELKGDRRYGDAVTALGSRYLADGATLVHGDYFPGSWLETPDGVRIIDPEFCFLGDPEFDCAILAAHAIIARCDPVVLEMITASAESRSLDLSLVAGYAGVEIMRRLIGVAQLPLICGIDRKRTLLQRSRRLVVEPERGLA
jgi:5-methylthioribose kinase